MALLLSSGEPGVAAAHERGLWPKGQRGRTRLAETCSGRSRPHPAHPTGAGAIVSTPFRAVQLQCPRLAAEFQGSPLLGPPASRPLATEHQHSNAVSIALFTTAKPLES